MELLSDCTSYPQSWVNGWMNPEQRGFKERTYLLARGWANATTEQIELQEDRVRLIVRPRRFSEAWQYFGPEVLVDIQKRQSIWCVTGISFYGD